MHRPALWAAEVEDPLEHRLVVAPTLNNHCPSRMPDSQLHYSSAYTESQNYEPPNHDTDQHGLIREPMLIGCLLLLVL